MTSGFPKSTELDRGLSFVCCDRLCWATTTSHPGVVSSGWGSDPKGRKAGRADMSGYIPRPGFIGRGWGRSLVLVSMKLFLRTHAVGLSDCIEWKVSNISTRGRSDVSPLLRLTTGFGYFGFFDWDCCFFNKWVIGIITCLLFSVSRSWLKEYYFERL